MKSKSKIIALVVLNMFFAVGIAQAAGLVNCGGTGQKDCQITDLVLIVVGIINFLLSWAWLVATLLIVWAGWGMVNAGGNEEEVVKAKATLSHALIGFSLIMVSFVLLNFIVTILIGDTSFQIEALKDAFRLLP